jgi:hypothetical protein
MHCLKYPHKILSFCVSLTISEKRSKNCELHGQRHNVRVELLSILYRKWAAPTHGMDRSSELYYIRVLSLNTFANILAWL